MEKGKKKRGDGRGGDGRSSNGLTVMYMSNPCHLSCYPSLYTRLSSATSMSIENFNCFTLMAVIVPKCVAPEL